MALNKTQVAFEDSVNVIGTVSANVKEALSGDPDLVLQVVSCLQEAVRLAANTKRMCQGFNAQYIEQLASPSVFQEPDRRMLENLCPRITPMKAYSFITRLEDMGLLDRGNKYATRTPTVYSPSNLTRPIVSQLRTELKRIYRSGDHELHEKTSDFREAEL
ncbi:hypothetical protein EDD11_001800 [Mortierella claussenii]|nr:hypothetical protein EDD11_001800 [Mortierella claussenii]